MDQLDRVIFGQSSVCRPIWAEWQRSDFPAPDIPTHVTVSYAIHERMAPSEDRWVNLPTSFIDKVAIQRDILEGMLGSIDIPNGDRGGDSTRVAFGRKSMGI